MFDVTRIKNLNLPEGKWCLVGGASLDIRGIRKLEPDDDIDILVTDELYIECEKQNCWVERILSECGARVSLALEDSYPPIELLPLSHFNNRVNLDFISKADIIDGIPVIRARDMLDWKRIANRPKDQEDIKLLEEYKNKND